VNYRGVAKTAALTRLLVSVTLLVLGVVLVACFGGGATDPARITPLDGIRSGSGAYGVLQAAGLLFFAFAGYARIATLGEEVKDPARTIRRAIPLALLVVVVTYGLVAVAVLLVLGAAGTAASEAPLRTAVAAGSLHALAPLVRVGAVAASLGVLLSAMAGVGRTTLAMARDAELPSWLAAVHPRFAVPHRAELVLGVVVVLAVCVTDLRGAIGFSSTGVLVYYAIANASAWTLPGPGRRWRAPLAGLGLLGCTVLVLSLPLRSVLVGLAVLVLGVVGRGCVRAARGR
jgi:APA family basic amino acid/polyamine antiporter